MKVEDFTPERASYLARNLEGHWTYTPPPLPPEIPPSWEMMVLVAEAERNLSELVGIARILPNPHVLIGPFVRQEAVLSSKIEGTQTSFSDLVLFEAGGQLETPRSDAQEVSNYIAALDYGLKHKSEVPVSQRLIKGIHQVLMQGVRGENKSPGDFRSKQVFIGSPGSHIEDAIYVPPPPGDILRRCLDDFEKYLHYPSDSYPPLVRLAITHYQFEAIHPFMDGNGRIGRLLLTLLLCDWGLLSEPLLYLSAYFERNRQEYYRLLLAVSQEGVWDAWVSFFLRGVAIQSRDAVKRAYMLQDLWRQYREALQVVGASGRALQLVDNLFYRPVTTIPMAQKQLELSYRGAQLVIEKLLEHGILQEMPNLGRTKMYWAPKVLDVMAARIEEEPARV